jgi:transglutaminase-like putative cysteine protease
MRTRVGDLGDTPWWVALPVALATALGSISMGVAGQLGMGAVSWTMLIGAITIGMSMSRRVRPIESVPSVERRSRPQPTHGSGWFVVLHGVVILAGAAPYLYWARGRADMGATISLIMVTTACIGLLFGTRSGLTISTAANAGMISLSLGADGSSAFTTGLVQRTGVVPWWLATVCVTTLLISAGLIARLGLAELATAPNTPAPFSANPTDKRGVGLFATPSRFTVIVAVGLSIACVLIGVMLRPIVEPPTKRVSEALLDRLSGDSGSIPGSEMVGRFRPSTGTGENSLLGAEDSFQIDSFGATNDREVLRVRRIYTNDSSPTATPLFRGQTFDQWDGRRWSSTAEVVRSVPSGEAMVPPRSSDLAADVVAYEVEVRSGRTQLVFGPSQIISVQFSESDLWLSEDGRIAIAENMGRGSRYQVISRRPPAGGAAMNVSRDALTATPGLQDYLDTSSLSPRARDLALQLGTNANTVGDVVFAVERWLGENVKYDFRVRHSKQGDVVDEFLFVNRAGWCEQVATSAVMLLRANGVPARLATGYLPSGTLVGDSQIIRGRDAHAWVEVFVPGVGWVERDPTQLLEIAQLPPETSRNSSLHDRRQLLYILLGLALFGVACWLVARARTRRTAQVDPITAAISACEAFGSERGRPRRLGETLTEFGRAVDIHLHDQPQRMTAVTARLEQARFSASVGEQENDPNHLARVEGLEGSDHADQQTANVAPLEDMISDALAALQALQASYPIETGRRSKQLAGQQQR